MENLIELIQKDFCQNHSREEIKDVLFMLRDQNPLEPPEQLMDLIVDILLSDEQPSSNNSSPSTTPVRSQEALWQNELDGSVGFGRSNIFSCPLNEILMKTFPDADEDFVREYCQREGNHFDLDKAVDTFSTVGYKRKVADVEAVCSSLQDAITFADPRYLMLVGQDEEDFSKRVQEDKNTNQDTTGFRVERFLEMFPDPERYFGNPNKTNPLESPEVLQEDIDYALTFLCNKYTKIRERHIRQVFEMMQKRLYHCCEYLDKFPDEMRRERQVETLTRQSKNPDLLQEVMYLKHRKFLRYHLKYRNQSNHKRPA